MGLPAQMQEAYFPSSTLAEKRTLCHCIGWPKTSPGLGSPGFGDQIKRGTLGTGRCQDEDKWVRGGPGGANPGVRVSHRVVGGLIAWCRDKGHL